MHRQRLLPSVLLVLTVACTKSADAPATTAVDETTIRNAIQAREREWSAAFLAHNAAGVAALYTEDGAQVQPSGDSFRGHDGITKAMQAQFDTLAVTAREDITEEVFAAGDYVVEIGRYSSQGTSKTDNTPRSSAGRYMVLWQKGGDGVWRLHRDIGTPAPPKKP